MGVANTKSTQVTNADAAVQTLNTAGISQGRLYAAVATVEVAAADDDGSVYRMHRIHSSWRIYSIMHFADAITGATSFDVGLYQTAANGAAVVDADAYGSAIDINAGTTSGADYTNESASHAIEKLGQQVWQDAGLSADSNRYYDLAYTANTVGSAAGTLVMRIYFTAGN
jgi:hypothetical protein